MKIVIDIPEEDYKNILDISKSYSALNIERIIGTIENGTPLPEHHGRLGDLDALEEYFKGVRKLLKASDYKNSTEFFVRDEMLLNFQQFIHLCDTIIEGSESK